MKRHAEVAGRRLCAGTGQMLHGLGTVLEAGSCWGLIGRAATVAAAFLFLSGLVVQVPELLAAVPPVWAVAAWRMSGSSATPPPLSAAPSGDVYAGETNVVARVVRSPEGVMCILHPVREEVIEP